MKILVRECCNQPEETKISLAESEVRHMSDEERKSRIQAIRRELRREYEYFLLAQKFEQVKNQLVDLLSMIHPKPEKTGW